MARPKLYHTREEQLAGARKRSSKHYEKNHQEILLARRAKYEKVKSEKTKSEKTHKKSSNTASEPTEEERKLRNRLKSRRSYQRCKSNVPRIRNPRPPPSPFTPTTQHGAKHPLPREESNAMAKHLAYLRRDFSSALGRRTVEDFIDATAMAYIETGFPNVLNAAFNPFNILHLRLQDYQGEILGKAGASTDLREAYQLSSEIMGVVRRLEDLWEANILRGREGFSEWYMELRMRSGVLNSEGSTAVGYDSIVRWRSELHEVSGR